MPPLGLLNLQKTMFQLSNVLILVFFTRLATSFTVDLPLEPSNTLILTDPPSNLLYGKEQHMNPDSESGIVDVSFTFATKYGLLWPKVYMSRTHSVQ